MGLETRPPPDGRPPTDASDGALAESRVASPPAEPEPSATLVPDLPDFAKKADDLEARGEGFQSRLVAAGQAASGLVDDLTSKGTKCPVAAALTDADRAELRLNVATEAVMKPGK